MDAREWSRAGGQRARPTCDECERAEAGEGGDVHLHVVQRLAEVEDGEQPVAEAAVALLLVEHHAVAEGELRVLGPSPVGVKETGVMTSHFGDRTLFVGPIA